MFKFIEFYLVTIGSENLVGVNMLPQTCGYNRLKTHQHGVYFLAAECLSVTIGSENGHFISDH